MLTLEERILTQLKLLDIICIYAHMQINKMIAIMNVFKALSDETKLRILKILQERDELCVCEIMQALDISQSRASRNLGILKNAGFVTDRREGSWIYYSLRERNMGEFARAVNDLMKQWLNEEEIIVEDRERLKTAIRLIQMRPCR